MDKFKFELPLKKEGKQITANNGECIGFLNGGEYDFKLVKGEEDLLIKIINNFDKAIELLEKMKPHLNTLIHLTCTGDKRNELTNQNIELLEFLRQLEL